MTQERKQELFNICAAHLLKQGEISATEVACRYRLRRNDKVLMCAAGPLIPESRYHKHLEGKNITNADVKAAANLTQEEAQFVRVIQTIHDNVIDRRTLVAEWPLRLKELAEVQGLVMVDVPTNWNPIEPPRRLTPHV